MGNHVNEQKKWISFINSFQKNTSRFPNNSYIDEYLVKVTMIPVKNFLLGWKKIINLSNKYNFESQNSNY